MNKYPLPPGCQCDGILTSPASLLRFPFVVGHVVVNSFTSFRTVLSFSSSSLLDLFLHPAEQVFHSFAVQYTLYDLSLKTATHSIHPTSTMAGLLSLLLACASLASAGTVGPRAVDALNEEAFAEAQQRDNGATRAFSNVQIKTSDGRCLFVDKLSGDFRANLTPFQVGTCGATDGQGFDIITRGKHNDAANSMLIVSTLTQACANFDPRRASGNQVNLFSCGGRADGGGAVTNSQLFTFNGGSGPLSLQPKNEAGSCFTVKGNLIDIAKCDSGDAKQSFTFGDAAAAGGNDGDNGNEASTGKTTATIRPGKTGVASATATATSAQTTDNSKDTTAASKSSTTCTRGTRTVTASAVKSNAQSGNQEATSAPSATGADETTSVTEETASATETASSGNQDATSAPSATGGDETTSVTEETASATETASSASGSGGITSGGVGIPNPTTPVPVSRAGGTLNPTAAAESNQRDETATRAFGDVEIRAPNGQCLFVDPTAGDFRQNLIPVGLVDCSGTPNERWDVISRGKHNNAQNSAIIVSSLMQGCISFDGRRPAGDTVTMFSCGGRADGGGETTAGQLMPFIGASSFAFAPESENNRTCILPGDDGGRLISGPCPTELGPQLFTIFP
ncbi:hypothetical protein GE09DRAFT_90297 [Coniochaeta sp. 2T2.1]|nr:hypothetical protein GE09DRAFT_90297 [Coniochaeta sp. 2T2.1]